MNASSSPRRQTNRRPAVVKFVLGGLAFTSATAAKAHASEILNRVPLGELLAGADARFVADLFAAHPERDVKLAGYTPIGYFVRRHPVYPNRNFMVRRSDGEDVHFSYDFALTPKPRARWFTDAARIIIDEQTRAYRDAYFARHAGPDGRAPSELSGLPLALGECDVHHAGEHTFRVIVATFLADRGIDPATVEYVGTTDGAPVLLLADAPLAADFAEYHRERAMLQVVGREEHRNLSRSRAGVGLLYGGDA